MLCLGVFGSNNAALAAQIECIEFYHFIDPSLLLSLADLGYKPPKLPPCSTLRLTGQIESGDAARVEQEIRRNLPFVDEMELVSPGGNVREAMLIGRVLRRFLISTQVPFLIDGSASLRGLETQYLPSDAGCESACFLVYVGGISRSGTRLGIHRPVLTNDAMRELTPEQAGQFYRDISAEIRQYLIDMDVQPHWLDDMMKVSSHDIVWVDFYAVIGELNGDTVAYAQWKAASCGELTDAERREREALSMARKDGNTLTTVELQREGQLDYKFAVTIKCGWKLSTKERVKLMH
jgi:hypothetical protein